MPDFANILMACASFFGVIKSSWLQDGCVSDATNSTSKVVQRTPSSEGIAIGRSIIMEIYGAMEVYGSISLTKSYQYLKGKLFRQSASPP